MSDYDYIDEDDVSYWEPTSDLDEYGDRECFEDMQGEFDDD